jgi:hypothetical protein
MYFREDVPLHSTVHREVLYTNRNFLRSDLVVLPVGEIAPSTGNEPVSTVTVSVTEHLEAEYPDGTDSILIATSGTDLIDALADVLSFGLNAVFSRDGDLVKRLVPDSLDESSRSSASKLFRNTFDSHRFVPEAELDELWRFMVQLLAFKRSHFEAAMRAIRRIVRATQRAVSDPTLAYVDFVAALESLSEGTDVPTPTWDRLDGRKRRVVNAALDGADVELADRVREAVMEAERLGFGNRFVAFVMNNVSLDFFRTEATGAVRPIRGADLERTLKLAYGVRSLNVHELEELPPEAWVIGDRADTVSPPGMGTMLSLEGLSRLSRHVVKSYVDRAPAEVDQSFDWRASLPGQLRMQLAPQYWIWNGEGFGHESADRYFSGFVGHFTDTLAGRSDGVTDMRAVLERIEQLLPGTAEGPAKVLMVAIYFLWHDALPPDDHRPGADAILAKYKHVLQQSEIASFVVGLLSGQMPEWTVDDWYALATDRRSQRETARHLELPPTFDATLQVMAAERLIEAGRIDEGRTLARFAVEELPGNGQLITWEAGLAAEKISELDLRALVLQLEPDTGPFNGADAGNDGVSVNGETESDDRQQASDK